MCTSFPQESSCQSSSISQSSPIAAPKGRCSARLIHSIFARGFLSVVTFLICGNPNHLVLFVTVSCPFSATDKAPGPPCACVHTGSFTCRSKGKPLVKHNPLHLKHQKDQTSGHLVQTTVWKSLGWPRPSLVQGKRRQQQSS